MSDQSLGEGLSRYLMDNKPGAPSVAGIPGTRRGGGCGCAGAGVPAFIIFALVLFALIFLPPVASDRYAGHGASVSMVNPTGEDAERDLTYSEVNQGNAKANLTNAGANIGNVFAIVLLVLAFAVCAIISVGIKTTFEKE